MTNRRKVFYDIGMQDFGNNIISVAKNGGDYLTIKEALESMVDSGTATGSGVGYIDDSGAAWEDDYFKGGVITITGTGAGTYNILSNTSTQIVFDYVGTPDSNCDYELNRASINQYFVIKVMPGTYTEDNTGGPIRLLDYVTIIGEQGGLDYLVSIQPLDPNQTLFRSAVGGEGGLRFLTIDGATGAYGILVDSGEYNYFYSLSILNCLKGIGVDGAGIFSYNDYFYIEDCDIGIEILNGAEMWSVIGAFATNNAAQTTAIYVDGSNSLLSSTVLDIEGEFTNGLYVDNGGIINAHSGTNIKGDIVNAIRFGSTGGEMFVGPVHFESTITNELLDETAFPYKATFRSYGVGDKSKIVSSNDDSIINIYGYNLETGQEGFVIGGRFISPWEETIFVSKPGRAIGDYSTIKEALDSITDASASKPYSIIVYPGVYAEDNPLTIPDYVSLISIGGASSTKILASNINSNVLNLGAYDQLQGFTISGATGATGIYFAGGTTASTAILDTAVENCLNGVISTGSGTQIYISRFRMTGSITNPVQVLNGGRLFLKTTRILTSDTDKAIVLNNGCWADVHDIYINPIVQITDGLYINDNSEIEVHGMSIRNYQHGVHIGNIVGNCIAHIDGLEASDTSSDFDVYIESTGNNVSLTAAIINRNKVYVASDNKYIADFYDASELDIDNEVRGFTGRTSFGSKQTPSAVYMGEGTHGYRGFVSLTNTNEEVGTWAVTTNDFISITTPYNLWAGITAGNCVYFGDDDRKYYGLRYNVVGAIDIGTGTYVHEYWNGSSWVEFHKMCTNRDSPYTFYSNCFSQASTKIECRFDVNIGNDWVSKELNGITAYWIRIRITSDIVTSPTLYAFKLHRNSREFKRDGVVQYYGTVRYNEFNEAFPAREQRKSVMASNVELIKLANGIWIGQNNYVLSNGEVNEVVFEPYSITGRADISCEMGVQFVCMTPATTGDIEFKIDFTVLMPDLSVVNGSGTVMSIVKTIALDGVAWKVIKVQAMTYLTSVLDGALLIGKLYRDARTSNVNDTVDDDVIVINPRLKYYVWKRV